MLDVLDVELILDKLMYISGLLLTSLITIDSPTMCDDISVYDNPVNEVPDWFKVSEKNEYVSSITATITSKVTAYFALGLVK